MALILVFEYVYRCINNVNAKAINVFKNKLNKEWGAASSKYILENEQERIVEIIALFAL